MKRVIISLVLCLGMAMAFSSCNKKNSTSEPQKIAPQTWVTDRHYTELDTRLVFRFNADGSAQFGYLVNDTILSFLALIAKSDGVSQEVKDMAASAELNDLLVMDLIYSIKENEDGRSGQIDLTSKNIALSIQYDEFTGKTVVFHIEDIEEGADITCHSLKETGIKIGKSLNGDLIVGKD